MGYNTYFTSELKLRDGVSVEEFEYLREACAEEGYLITECKVSSNGYIEIFETARYEFDYVWGFLAKVAEGSVWARGEDDNDIWKVEIKNGQWKEIPGNLFYGELTDEFLKRYEQQMPDELKNKLHAWWDAQRLLKGV